MRVMCAGIAASKLGLSLFIFQRDAMRVATLSGLTKVEGLGRTLRV